MTDTNILEVSGLPTPRAAGEVQISALPEATTPINENDITNIKQGVEDKKVTVKDLLAPHADKTGNVHGMVPSDINLGNVANYPITDAVDDMDSHKYASAKAVALLTERMNKQTPVNHILLSLNSENPANCGYIGTWELISKGRALIGYDPANAQRPAGTEFGSDTLTISTNQLPRHTVRLTGSVVADGAHTHNINVNTGQDGLHSHPLTATATAVGAHSHAININTNQEGNHNHSFSGSTSVGGQHTHTINLVRGYLQSNANTNTAEGRWGEQQTSPSGEHSHSFSGGTSLAGQHFHNVNGMSNAAGDHTHNITTNMSNAGSHTHNVSGATVSAGQHTHQIDLTSQSVGGGEAISVTQKSLVIYMWMRTA